jgi:general secretion pathway protein D
LKTGITTWPPLLALAALLLSAGAARAEGPVCGSTECDLDTSLPQVLIESAIISVDLSTSKNLGVSEQEANSHGIGNYFNGAGGTTNVLSQSTLFPGTATNATGSLAGGFSYLAHLRQDLDPAVTAAAADARVKILQCPRVQTSHGVEAKIFVGAPTPYPTGSYCCGPYGGSSSIQQMQFGVTLDVTPLINSDGLVVMEIAQQIDSVVGSVHIANIGDLPTAGSKSAQAKMTVRDHETIIMGGLIETNKSDSYSGVPVLKDIPLMGSLFRSRTKREDRSEILVLIRPTVLPSPQVEVLTTRAEKNKMPGAH